MKTFIPACIAVAAFSFAALPLTAHAKDWEKERKIAERFLEATSNNRDRDRDRNNDNDRRYRDRDDDRDRDRRDWDRDRDRDRDRNREVYFARPASTFVLTLGDGYAGRGYYYGPANSSYFYERQGVRYYRTREAVPQQYWGGQSQNFSRTEASVQRALAQRGYYNGPIDGDMGPGSRAAVARYQAANGMKPTGAINDGLLRSLGL